MDISTATKEQKSAAAVAYLAQNMNEAPEEVKKQLEKLNTVNNEGMALVQQVNELRDKIKQVDNEIGQKIGAAKVLFEVIGDAISEKDIDKFASKFEIPKQSTPADSGAHNVDIAGATASKNPIIVPKPGIEVPK